MIALIAVGLYIHDKLTFSFIVVFVTVILIGAIGFVTQVPSVSVIAITGVSNLITIIVSSANSILAPPQRLARVAVNSRPSHLTHALIRGDAFSFVQTGRMANG